MQDGSRTAGLSPKMGGGQVPAYLAKVYEKKYWQLL